MTRTKAKPTSNALMTIGLDDTLPFDGKLSEKTNIRQDIE